MYFQEERNFWFLLKVFSLFPRETNFPQMHKVLLQMKAEIPSLRVNPLLTDEERPKITAVIHEWS